MNEYLNSSVATNVFCSCILYRYTNRVYQAFSCNLQERVGEMNMHELLLLKHVLYSGGFFAFFLGNCQIWFFKKPNHEYRLIPSIHYYVPNTQYHTNCLQIWLRYLCVLNLFKSEICIVLCWWCALWRAMERLWVTWICRCNWWSEKL